MSDPDKPERAIDRLIARFRESRGGRQSFTDAPSGITVWWDPWTLGEEDRVFHDMTKDELFRPARFARVLIVKALDENGNRLFARPDEAELLGEVDPGLVRRLAQPMIADMNRDNGADPKKKPVEGDAAKH